MLLNGPTAEVVETVIFTVFALVAFVACMERFFLVRMSWAETFFWGASALAMIWVGRPVNYSGLIIFLVLATLQIIMKRKEKKLNKTLPKTAESLD